MAVRYRLPLLTLVLICSQSAQPDTASTGRRDRHDRDRHPLAYLARRPCDDAVARSACLMYARSCAARARLVAFAVFFQRHRPRRRKDAHLFGTRVCISSRRCRANLIGIRCEFRQTAVVQTQVGRVDSMRGDVEEFPNCARRRPNVARHACPIPVGKGHHVESRRATTTGLPAVCARRLVTVPTRGGRRGPAASEAGYASFCGHKCRRRLRSNSSRGDATVRAANSREAATVSPDRRARPRRLVAHATSEGRGAAASLSARLGRPEVMPA